MATASDARALAPFHFRRARAPHDFRSTAITELCFPKFPAGFIMERACFLYLKSVTNAVVAVGCCSPWFFIIFFIWVVLEGFRRGGRKGCFVRWLCAESAERRAPVHVRDIDSLWVSPILFYFCIYLFSKMIQGVFCDVGLYSSILLCARFVWSRGSDDLCLFIFVVQRFRVFMLGVEICFSFHFDQYFPMLMLTTIVVNHKT